MADEVPLYVVIEGQSSNVGTLSMERDGSISGSISPMLYKILEKTGKRYYFALVPERENL